MQIKVSPWFIPVITTAFFFPDATPFFFGLMAAVLVHEGAHIIVAKCFGVKTQELKILPIGGRIKIESNNLPKDKKVIILLAGVAGNVVFALSIGLFLWLLPSAFLWLEGLIIANATVAILNLIPFGPLDGGQILKTLRRDEQMERLLEKIAKASGDALAREELDSTT